MYDDENEDNFITKDQNSDIGNYKLKIVLIVTSFIIFITLTIFILVLIFKADSSNKDNEEKEDDEIIIKDNIISLHFEITNTERKKNIIHQSFINFFSYMNITNLDTGYNFTINPQETYLFEETGN